jgi:prolyl-tRNA synthetase
MGLQYLDRNNKLQDVWMGSYGIGPARAMAALAEQNADDTGISWPVQVAPYKVAVVIISMKDEKQIAAANDLYNQLTAKALRLFLMIVMKDLVLSSKIWN